MLSGRAGAGGSSCPAWARADIVGAFDDRVRMLPDKSWQATWAVARESLSAPESALEVCEKQRRVVVADRRSVTRDQEERTRGAPIASLRMPRAPPLKATAVYPQGEAGPFEPSRGCDQQWASQTRR